MKSFLIPSRLLWLGGSLLLAGVFGSQSEESHVNTRLRRQKRRNALAVEGGTGSRIPASNPTAFSGRNSYGYNDETRYYQNIQPPVYYETVETNAPIVAEIPTVAPSKSYGTSTGPTIVNEVPTQIPTIGTEVPTKGPTITPTIVTEVPTFTPTILTEEPSLGPTIVTEGPTFTPTIVTDDPTAGPTTIVPTDTGRPTLDPNAFILSLQEVPGICGGPVNGIGCANENPEDDPAGNPNDIVNCYNAEIAGVETPFSLNAIRVWIGDSTVLTPDLQVNVWVGNVNGTGPISNRLLYSEERFGYTFGENTFELNMGRLIFQANFCVGVTARSSNAGLRVMTDISGDGDSSYLRSPECGLENFTSLLDAGLQNDFCIEALVSSVNR